MRRQSGPWQPAVNGKHKVYVGSQCSGRGGEGEEEATTWATALPNPTETSKQPMYSQQALKQENSHRLWVAWGWSPCHPCPPGPEPMHTHVDKTFSHREILGIHASNGVGLEAAIHVAWREELGGWLDGRWRWESRGCHLQVDSRRVCRHLGCLKTLLHSSLLRCGEPTKQGKFRLKLSIVIITNTKL